MANRAPSARYSLASHPKPHRLRIPALEIAITRQRPQREEFPVAVVAQIEYAREPGRGVMPLAPEPVGALRAREIVDAARHRRMIDLARRHQAKQRPGGLRGRAGRRLVAAVIELVARAVLAP